MRVKSVPPIHQCRGATEERQNIALMTTCETVLPACTTTVIKVNRADGDLIPASVLVQGLRLPSAHLFAMNLWSEKEATSTALLVTNTSNSRIVLSAGQIIAKCEAAQVILDAKEPRTRTKDIRLTPKYLRYIEEHFGIDKSTFTETCYNGGDFISQNWTEGRRLWINPPWEEYPKVVAKLLRDKPHEFILIVPVFEKPTLWFNIIRRITEQLASKDYGYLPRNIDKGYFDYWEDGRRKTSEPLPFPDYDILVIHGNRESLEQLTTDDLTNLVVQLETALPVLTKEDDVPQWLVGTNVGDMEQEQQRQLIQLLAQYQDVLASEKLGHATAMECEICTSQRSTHQLQTVLILFNRKEHCTRRSQQTSIFRLD